MKLILRASQYKLLLVLQFFLVVSVFAQKGIPIIKPYSVENYQAGIENWDAIQDNRGLMYFANSEGVLEFDGVHWRLIQTKNKAKIRSLGKSEEGIIYVGGDSEFGYLISDKNGQKVYVSLIDHCPPKYRHYTNHVWKVIVRGNQKFFLAGGAVIVLDEENKFVKIIEADIYLRSLFLIGNEIYAYSNKTGLLVLDNNTLQFFALYHNEFILNRSLEFISAHPKGGIRVHIFGEGFYRLHQRNLALEKKDRTNSLDSDYIFCKGYIDELLLLGTTTNGLYALSNLLLDTKYHFDKSIGLNDNKIFSIYTDHDNNLWVCHENGLSYIELNAPVRLIAEKMGISGIGSCSNIFDSTLFVGTTHGLFSCKLGANDYFYNFSLFKRIRQPIYFLEKKGKSLIIGCHLEIFEYDGKNLKVLSTSRHNNKIVAFPGRSNHYLVSHDKGFLLLKYEKGFQVIGEVAGIHSEIVDFEIDSNANTWVINSKGELLLARLNNTMDSFAVVKSVEEPGNKLKFLATSSFNRKVLFGTNKGLFGYDRDRDGLKIIDKEEEDKNQYAVNWLYNQNNKDLWYEKAYYSNGKLHYRIDILSEKKDDNQAQSLNSVIYGSKAFSFGKFNESELAIGTSEGFLLYNLNFRSKKQKDAESYIRRIVVTDAKDTTILEGVWLRDGNKYEIPLNQELTQIELDCAANYFYSQDKVMYSYKMDGIDTDWKEWSKDNTIKYSVNGDGEFTFHVRSTSNYNAVSNTTSYRFIIKKPWYKTFWWYGIEMGILIIIMSVSFYFNRNGSTKASKASAFILVLIILTVFEIISELTQDWIDAQGVTIFTLKIAINIFIALTITPVELWVRKKLIRTVPGTFPGS